MRPDQAFPVRPAVMPGESLSSYALRLADANGLSHRAVLPAGFTDATAPRRLVEQVAVASGLTTDQVRSMTLAPMPPTLRGRGKLQRHGWRLHDSVQWVCPACTSQTGYQALLWRTGLMPVCTRCSVLLVQAHDIPLARPAPAYLIDLVEELTHLVQAATARHAYSRDRLSRFRKTCAAVAQTIDADWPPRPGHLPDLDRGQARTWGPHPCPDPATTAVILAATAPALGARRVRAAFINEAMDRVHRAQPLALRVVLPRRLPIAPPGSPILPGFTHADAYRLRVLLSDLQQGVATVPGLAPRHIPAFLVLPGEDPIPAGDVWRDRALAAIGLHMLISRADGQVGAASTACHDFGTADTESNRLLDGLRLGRGIHADEADLLRSGVRHLADEGLVDYRARRRVLSSLRRLPAVPICESRFPDLGGVPGPALALGWMWVHRTRGPMWTSPWPTIRTSTVLAFDAVIDSEARLTLHETATALIEGPDLSAVMPTTAPAAAERRSG